MCWKNLISDAAVWMQLGCFSWRWTHQNDIILSSAQPIIYSAHCYSYVLNTTYWFQGGLTQDEVWLYPMQFHSIVLSLFSSLIAPFGGFFASGFKRAFKVKVYRESTFFCIDNVYRYWNANLHSVTCDLIFIYAATHHALL